MTVQSKASPRTLIGLPGRIVRHVKNEIIRHREEVKWRETIHPCRGGNKQQVFVLRRRDSIVGLGSNIIFFLGQLKYMEEFYPNAVPYFDLEHYEQSLSERPGNAWEDFFVQPCVKSVDFKRDYYVLGNGTLSAEGYKLPYYIHYDELVSHGIKALFDKYFIMRPDLLCEFQAKVPDCFERRVLGVKLRGTDYAAVKPAGHPIQPSISDVIPKINEAMNRYGFNYIFLATEDEVIKTQMKNIYSDLLVCNDSALVEYSGDKFLLDESIEGKSKYVVTKDYLFEMWLLAQCNGLITGNTSGVVATLLMNGGKYEYVDVIEMGYYPG